MSVSDDDDSQYTAEDIVSSVLQTKSKLSGQLTSRSSRRSRLKHKENDIASSVDYVSSISQNHHQSECTPAGKSKYASYENTIEFNRCTQGTESQRLCYSTSKMTRSVSTPEINVKFMQEPMSYTKSKAHRQVIFPSTRGGDFSLDRLKNPDTLFQLMLNDGEDKSHSHSYNLSRISEKSSSSHSLSNLYRKQNNTGSTKLYQRDTWYLNDRTDDNKENVDCDRTLEAKLPAVPLTSTFKKSLSLQHTKSDERKILERIPDNGNLTKENITSENDSKSECKNSSPSLSLHIGNSDLITVNKLNYLKMGELGKGGSSVVYEVLDMQTKQRKAIKVVTLDEEDEATRLSYKNEIKILQRLQHSSRVIKLFDHEEGPSHLKLVMEAGSVDLSSMITAVRQKKGKPIPAFTVMHYWQEMLLAVQVIHKEGIIHSDLKPANFLQANGMLKLIDFGIASSVQQDMTSVLKDSQSGTYNFMSPESLNDIYSGPIISSKIQDKPTIKINVKSDVWSLGCILYNLVYGKTPFQHVINPLQKLAAISNPKTVINFPLINDKNLLDVLHKCLQFDPYKRPSIRELLCHPYLEESASLQVSGKDPPPPPNTNRMNTAAGYNR